MKINRTTLLAAVLTLLLMAGLVACSQSAGPAETIEQYVMALVAKDDVAAANLACADWESSAEAEGASFEGVEVSLDGMACQATEQTDTSAVVSCQGQILFSYAGGETEAIDLSARDYQLALEGGEWRMCGYK